MNIVLIGASGYVGSAILKEALDRGHHVTAVARDPEKLTRHPNLHPRKADIYQEGEVAKVVAGHEAVISAFNPGWSNPDIYNQQIKGTRAIINGVKQAGLTRVLFVGGAGSLEVQPGVQALDRPEFPKEYKQGALATREALAHLRQETNLDWSYLSPSADLFPGSRIGHFRVGTDQMLKDANGASRISVQDYAMAMIDELEKPAHVRRRFTVGY
ncbi:MAG: NAD(P)-dependent oxidoreductase [Nitrospira sp.]